MVQQGGHLVEIVEQDGYLAKGFKGDLPGPFKALDSGRGNAGQVRKRPSTVSILQPAGLAVSGQPVQQKLRISGVII